jgi:hypothetical protein
MEGKLKHYLYISDTKVDMLYAQIEPNGLNRLSIELSIDLKPFGAGVGATIKPTLQEETRISKLRLVVKFLEEHHTVGWIDAPETYFKGSLPMEWGVAFDREDARDEPPYAAYFIGKTDRTAVGLVGSTHHLIGKGGSEPKYTRLFYTPHSLLKALASTTERPAALHDDELWQVVYDMDLCVSTTRWQQRPLEFIAVTYVFSTHGPYNKRFLLGSPIYVAFAE